MNLLTPALQHHILCLLDSGHSCYQISSQSDISNATISTLHSKHCPNLQKSSGGHPTKLSKTNICHAIHLIGSGRAEIVVQVTKTLRDVVNQPISTQTIWNSLKKIGLKAVVMKKRPRLTPHHRKERLDFAIRHQHWIWEDWKKVVWSAEAKVNPLGSDGRKLVWKMLLYLDYYLENTLKTP